MAAQITQETFDSVVRENMEEFEMEVQDAIDDAVIQFKSQGVKLDLIVKDARMYVSGTGDSLSPPSVTDTVAALNGLLKHVPVDHAAVKSSCQLIASECDIDLAHRCLAAKNNAYPALISACTKTQSDADDFTVCLKSLCALCKGQPDLLDDETRATSLEWLRHFYDNVTVSALVVRFIRLMCVMHEGNRQNFVGDGLIGLLMKTLETHKADSATVREVCSALRVLTQDDDVRAAFGKAHDNAKMIVNEEGALAKIMNICKDYRDDKEVLRELFATLSCLAVRNEFCQDIVDLGGLTIMLETLENNMDNQGLTKQVLGVLKTIAGNDDVKIAIVKNGGLVIILEAMTKYIRNAGICEIGCAALTMVVLRETGHSAQVMGLGGADLLVRIMQLHPKEEAVQKQVCMTIRNLVARCREFCPALLDLGVEALLRDVIARHQSCHEFAKAALRDLDCRVELKEIWTGEGRSLSRD